MPNPYIVFGRPKYSDEEIAEVTDSLQKGWIGTGEKVAAFERKFADHLGVSSCVAVNSCTAALHLSLLESGLKPGDEVITTAMTFCATVNTIIHVGAKPVLVDIDCKDWNISAESIERSITSQTKAILVVHFAGRPCDMEQIVEIAKKYSLILIEDCAHAIESQVNGRPVGTFGDFAAFSFYSTKNISSGEGGVIVAKGGSEKLDSIRQKALHGMDKDAFKRFSADGKAEYDVTFAGYKYNMMDLQAAIAYHQLKQVHVWHSKREKIWHHYLESFSRLPVLLPADIPSANKHAYHLFQILPLVEKSVRYDRATIRQLLHLEGVGTGIHYKSIADFSYYQKAFSWESDGWRNSKYFGDRTISIPLSPHLSDTEVERIVLAVRKVLRDV